MKFVVTSDWHGDAVTHGIPRFEEISNAAHESVDCAIAEGADAYLFLGDLCDPDCGSQAFRTMGLALDVASRLSARGIDSIWLAGNHDVIEDGTGNTTLTPLRSLGNSSILARDRAPITVAELPCRVDVVGKKERRTIVCLPFTASSRPYDPELAIAHFAEAAPKERVLVIGHLNVPGVVPGDETTDYPRGREVTFPTTKAFEFASTVLHGHYHRQQRTKEGIWIPGSLARLTFGEENNRPGFLVVNA